MPKDIKIYVIMPILGVCYIHSVRGPPGALTHCPAIPTTFGNWPLRAPHCQRPASHGLCAGRGFSRRRLADEGSSGQDGESFLSLSRDSHSQLRYCKCEKPSRSGRLFYAGPCPRMSRNPLHRPGARLAEAGRQRVLPRRHKGGSPTPPQVVGV